MMTCDWLIELNPWPCDFWHLQRLIQSIWETPDCDLPAPFSHVTLTRMDASRWYSWSSTVKAVAVVCTVGFLFVCLFLSHFVSKKCLTWPSCSLTPTFLISIIRLPCNVSQLQCQALYSQLLKKKGKQIPCCINRTNALFCNRHSLLFC